MKYLLALLLVVPAAANDTSKSADASGWRVDLQPVEQPWTYVDSGGRGEFLILGIHVTTTRLKWTDPLPEAFKFRIRIQAEGLPEYRVLESMAKSGRSADARGVSIDFWTYLRLAPLDAYWGKVPSTLTISAALSDDGVPAVSSPAMTVGLKPVARKDATWEQRVRSLRVGQVREEVLDLLGPALKEVHSRRADRTWQSTLTYPNANAPDYLPVEMQVTNIYLDQRGRVLWTALHGGC